MTEPTNTETPAQDEKKVLQDRLNQMGVKYHPNAGVEKLRTLLTNTLEGQTDGGAIAETMAEADKNADPKAVKKETLPQRKARMRREASQQVRIRIQCMNPNKKDWEGEIFSVGNKFVGTFRKYVPFGHVWHVPRIIYNMIKARQCQVFHNVIDSRGNKVRKGKLIPEFSIEVLNPLTEQELAELKAQQAAAGGVADA